MSIFPSQHRRWRIRHHIRRSKRKIYCTLLSPLKKLRHRRSIGARGERYAQKFLEENLLIVKFSNWRSRFGELDLIALHNRTLIFVEVKSRFNPHPNWSPFEQVSLEKEKHLRSAAHSFIRNHGPLIRRCRVYRYRIDLIGVRICRRWGLFFPEIAHYQDAITWRDSGNRGYSGTKIF